MPIKDEKGHFIYVNILYTKRYGLECAVMLDEILRHAKKKEKHLDEEDEKWFVLSESDMKFMFPFWSLPHAQLILQKLIYQKVIKEKPAKGKKKRYFAFATKENLA